MKGVTRLARRLLSREQRRFIKFCVVGASGVPVNLAFTWLGNRLLSGVLPSHTAVALASLLGIAVSIASNFLLNDLWTWGDRRQPGAARGGRLLRFYLVSSLAAGVQFGVAMALALLLGLHYLLAQLAGIALAMLLNYVANHWWTFRARPGAAAPEAAPAATAGALGTIPPTGTIAPTIAPYRE